MRIFPAVDILGGRCVQLVQGKRESATVFGDPLACATRWLDLGADALHVVNLDGAFGSSGKNVELITELVNKTGVEIELGGGIRSAEDAARWIKTGVTRIIISTLATREPESIRNLSEEYGSDRIMAGVDAKGGQIAVQGWQVTAGDYLDWAGRFENSVPAPCSTRMSMWKGSSREFSLSRLNALSIMCIYRWLLPGEYRHARILPVCGMPVRSAQCSDQPCTAGRSP